MIATGQKSKTLHKEELNMSETERRIKRNVEENARLQQKKRSVQQQQQQQQQSHSQSAKTTPQRRENKVPLSLSLFSQLHSVYFVLFSLSLSLSPPHYFVSL
jgi:deubiquitinating protein VCIP135